MGIIIFVSYSHRDKEIFQISRIIEGLKEYQEIEEVLYYESGEYSNFMEYMNSSIDRCDLFLFFCSKNTKKSNFIKAEWQAAIASEKIVIPIYFSLEDVPELLNPRLGVHFHERDVELSREKIFHAIQKALG